MSSVQDVLRAVTPLWQIETNDRQISNLPMIKRTLAWAGAHGHRDPNAANPADWDLALKYVMPAPKRGGNFAAMPYADVPAFVQSLRDIGTVFARALEFIVLVWARKTEVLEMVWSEVDLDKALWTVPAKRMKGGEIHRVPLSARATEILCQQHIATGGKGLVFPSTVSDNPISKTVLNRLVPRPYTLHGFRSAASTWANDCTEFPHELIEMNLAHSVGNAAARAYRRSTALERRREIMKMWDDYLTS